MDPISTQRYYVYVLLDPRKPGPFSFGKYHFFHEPFYVGKGQRKRSESHLSLKEGSTEKKIRITEIVGSGNRVGTTIIYETDDEASAYTEESSAIKTIGRINGKKRGPLLNCNDGWDGEFFRFCRMIREP